MATLSKITDWITSPSNDDTTVQFWLLGLLAVLVASFLWAQVVNLAKEV